MEKINLLFGKLKNRFSLFLDDFKNFEPVKKAIVIVICLLCLCSLVLLFLLFRAVIGKIILGIGVILFFAGVVLGVKEKSLFLAIVIILISLIPLLLGNALIPKEETLEPTTEAPVRSIVDVTDETTTEEPIIEEPETTEAPETEASETEPPAPEEHDYVINTNTGVFHRPGCSSVGKMKSKNRADWHCTRDEVLAAGYKPCSNCNP